jgi:hypothetical protein
MVAAKKKAVTKRGNVRRITAKGTTPKLAKKATSRKIGKRNAVTKRRSRLLDD